MDREHLHNQVIREIITRIAAGVYQQEKRLPSERSLCEEFGVSRATLREALAGLAKLGVVVIKRGSGTYVQGLSRAKLPSRFLPPDFNNVNLQDVVEARQVIETAAVAMAAQRITSGQLGELEHLVEQMHASLDEIPAFLELDMAFHRSIVQASGNPVLVTAFQAICEYHHFSTVFTSRQEGEEAEALNYHRRLLAALSKRNVSASRRILGQHLATMSKYSRKVARPCRA